MHVFNMDTARYDLDTRWISRSSPAIIHEVCAPSERVAGVMMFSRNENIPADRL